VSMTCGTRPHNSLNSLMVKMKGASKVVVWMQIAS
jgi:hypothetical protein